jgi:hypothetical protein
VITDNSTPIDKTRFTNTSPSAGLDPVVEEPYGGNGLDCLKSRRQ